MPETENYARYEARLMVDEPEQVAAFHQAGDTITLSVTVPRGIDGLPIVRFTGPEVAVQWLLDALHVSAVKVDGEGTVIEGSQYPAYTGW